MVDTKRTTGRSFEEKLHVLHDTIYRPDKTGQQIVPSKPAFKLSYRIIKQNTLFHLWEKGWYNSPIVQQSDWT